jgi:FKBP-type peptidyl-prolyl cis-trans isomerase
MTRKQQTKPSRHCATKPREVLKMIQRLVVAFVLLASSIMVMMAAAKKGEVVVETIQPGLGPPVTTDYQYTSHVTLYLDDGQKTPSGWSTRKEHGADSDNPFTFQPGRNLIAGWTTGVLQMKEGKRAMLHVPAALGYGAQTMGSPQGAFYIPANSDLLFDIEVIGKFSEPEM